MAFSQVSVEESLRVKKTLYMGDVDEYCGSSQALSNIVLSTVLNVVPVRDSTKPLKPGYVADLTREGGISPCSLMLGLLYIKRLSQVNPGFFSTLSSRELFLVSMMISSKYLNDEGEMEALTNSDFASIGYTPKNRLDQLEVKFLDAMDWRLFVSLDDYYQFVTSIEGRVAFNQASERGWFTYTDMCAVWEASDIHNDMLTASKQTAKVACGSALLYLVCMATLFASTPSLQSSNDLSSLQLAPGQNEMSSTHLTDTKVTFDLSPFEDNTNVISNHLGGFMNLDPLQNSTQANRSSTPRPLTSSLPAGQPLTSSVSADRPLTSMGVIESEKRNENQKNHVDHDAVNESKLSDTGGVYLESGLFLLLNLTAALASPDLFSPKSSKSIETTDHFNPLSTALLCPDTQSWNYWVNPDTDNFFASSQKDDKVTSGSIPTCDQLCTSEESSLSLDSSSNIDPTSNFQQQHTSASVSIPPKALHDSSTPSHKSYSIGDQCETDLCGFCDSSELSDYERSTTHKQTFSSSPHATDPNSVVVSMDTIPIATELRTISMATLSSLGDFGLYPAVEKSNFTVIEVISMFARSVLAY